MTSLLNHLFWRLALVGVIAITCSCSPDPVEVQDSNAPRLPYYARANSYCGKGPIENNPVTIPQIGCFLLSTGHSANANFSTHHIEVAVDDSGMEVLKADGSLIKRTNGTPTQTNLDYVKDSGSGIAVCASKSDMETIHRCPAAITVFKRNSDKSILFMVSECLPPEYGLCFLDQENLDYERSRRQGILHWIVASFRL